MSSPGGLALFPAYRPRPSPLHAAGAVAGGAFCAGLGLAFVLFDHPLVVAAALLAVCAAFRLTGLGREGVRAARLGVAVAALVALVNPLVSTAGDTLLVRGYAVLGHRFDVTLEAIVYGAVAGLRLLGLILVCALFSAAVDPDEVLRSLRRVSYRFALTTVLATRLVPVLARDASRRSEAARCRPRPVPRRALAHAALAGALERAVEVAAALEVRGYSRPPARARSWPPRARSGSRPVAFGRGGFPARQSRHEARVGASAAALAGVVLVAAAAGGVTFEAYPRLEASGGSGVVALAVGIVVLSIVPFVGSPARLGAGTRASVPMEVPDG